MNIMWAITLSYSADADRNTLDSWEDALAEHDATAARIPNEGSTLTLYVDAADPIDAVSVGGTLARPVTDRTPSGVEVLDEEAHVERALRPNLPELVSAPEVGEILGGITRQRVYQLQRTNGFPEPLYNLRTGPVWDATAIRAFAANWDRKPGRRPAPPAKTAKPATKQVHETTPGRAGVVRKRTAKQAGGMKPSAKKVGGDVRKTALKPAATGAPKSNARRGRRVEA
ncbi:hypothetical protein WSS_A38286 [Rhodococcus opacus M213]|uniref:Uncharacterized protein n=1 Tax=Rhodococcus opacus M213 TaxID=1129896 RepID=K8X788_RHOOP|nr:hypothetical protein [Rhodococcus opacus]EKT77333.1 hypothetical protein WSS_A38286 [Rhodococcus opacus M213]